MSEFYKLRRTKITDGMALAGFVLGFLIPAYAAGKRLADGFDFGNEVQSLTTFVITILLSAFTGGFIGLVAGLICGWVWEQLHKVMRKPVGDGEALAPSNAVSGESSRIASQVTARPAIGDIRFDNSGYTASEFLILLQRAMPAEYDVTRIITALERTDNIGAWDGERLVGAVRVLSDGYLFATIPEIIVDPEYRRRGIGRELMQRALDRAPTGIILFGSPPSAAGFFEKLGCQRATSGFVLRRKVVPSVQTR